MGFSAVLSTKISLAESCFWHSAGVFMDCQGWLVVKIAFRVAVAWISPELPSLHLQYCDSNVDFPVTVPGIKWFCNRPTMNAAVSSSVFLGCRQVFLLVSVYRHKGPEQTLDRSPDRQTGKTQGTGRVCRLHTETCLLLGQPTAPLNPL